MVADQIFENYRKPTLRDEFLKTIEAIVPWTALCEVIEPQCPGPEGAGWHVVLETEHGLTALMLIPGDQVKAPGTASKNGWYAQVQPAGRGHFAIVTTTVRSADAVSQLIRQNVRWDQLGQVAALAHNVI